MGELTSMLKRRADDMLAKLSSPVTRCKLCGDLINLVVFEEHVKQLHPDEYAPIKKLRDA